MRIATFTVFGPLDSAGQHIRGTVLIDRDSGLVTTLSSLATIVCQRTLIAEDRQKKADKKKQATAKKGSPRRG